MKNNAISSHMLMGITLAVGIALAGWFIGDAIKTVRSANRYVSVKGFSERDVAADLAIWPLTFHETENDLIKLQQRVDKNRKTIHRFLTGLGFTTEEISEAPPQITDFQSQGYARKDMPPYRYKAEAAVTLRSSHVARVKQAMEKAGLLVSEGIVLVRNYEQQPEFLFTGLNKIKPEMIAEATRSARKAAEQFAIDSGSRVGAIRTARQGLFTIRDRDRNSKDLKKVRVVTSVEYFLQKH